MMIASDRALDSVLRSHKWTYQSMNAADRHWIHAQIDILLAAQNGIEVFIAPLVNRYDSVDRGGTRHGQEEEIAEDQEGADSTRGTRET